MKIKEVILTKKSNIENKQKIKRGTAGSACVCIVYCTAERIIRTEWLLPELEIKDIHETPE